MFLFLKPAFNIFKKVLLVVIVYFAVISLFSHFISKDKIALSENRKDPILENRAEIYKLINNKELNKTPQGKIAIVVYRSMTCSLMGEACTDNPIDADKNFSKSFLGFINNLVVLPFSNPPASGVAWTYSGLADTGFFPKALAAEGIGMGSIQPFAKIWKVFRDVTYLLLVVILIAIGFMVMFRTKINPQTVISVENSLPKIIGALILITFSFAIAGFMIDLMYILIAIITSILGPIYMSSPASGSGIGGTGLQTTAELQKYYLTADLGALYKGIGKLNDSMWGTILWRLPNSILGLIPLFGHTIKTVGGLVLTFFGAGIINDIALALSGVFVLKPILDPLEATTGIGAALHIDKLLDGFKFPIQYILVVVMILLLINVAVPLILGVVIWFSLVFVFFRILFMLFSSYIKILLSIVLSPIYLLFEAIPGQSAFTNWIKNLAGELITFPLVVGIFVLGTIIADSASAGNLMPFPFIGGVDSKSFGYIIGMALFFMTPDLVAAVRQIFIPKPGLLEGAGPGVFFGGAVTGVSGGLGELSKVAGIGFYIKPIRDLLQKIPGGKAIFADNAGQHNPNAH